MRPEDFKFLADLVRERSGLALNSDKAYLLESRLMPLARKRGLKGLEELVRETKSKGDEELLQDITEAMTTNESFFFRDIKPFEMFRQNTLPQFLEKRARSKSIRIWSAACSSGQEPYSLAMVLQEEVEKLAGWKIDIVGTDLSNDILRKARSGIYSQFEVQRGLPMQMLVKYFEKKDESWVINESIRSMVKFRELNLLTDFKSLGKFDIVFCRNVLIYFDQATKTEVLSQICDLMPEDGVLFLGGAETVLGISDRFKPMPNFRGVYAVSGDKSVSPVTSTTLAASP